MSDDSRRCFVVVHITDSMAAGPSRPVVSATQVLYSPQQESTVISLSSKSDFKVPQLGVVSLYGASGNTLYWALLLVYVGSLATHFTGYCCWLTKVCPNRKFNFGCLRSRSFSLLCLSEQDHMIVRPRF
jgi:hypothetical protein